MVDYLVIAKAEVLSEKAHRILSKYTKFTNYDDENAPETVKQIEADLSVFAKK